MHALLLFLVLLWAVPVQAATFSDASFESCTTNGTVADFPTSGTCDNWRYLNAGTPTNMGIVTANPFSGTKSMRLSFVTPLNKDCVTTCTGIHNTAGSPASNPWQSPQTHIAVRFAIHVSSGFTIGVGNTKLLRLKDGSGSSYPVLWMMLLDNGNYGFCMEGPYDRVGVTECVPAFPPNKGTWEQLEIDWQLNTPGQSNGYIRMWVNDTQRINKTGRQDIGPTPTSHGASHGLLNSSELRINTAHIYLQSGVGTIQYDRIAIGNSRIGTVGGTIPPPPTDTTPPSPPTSVTVQ